MKPNRTILALFIAVMTLSMAAVGQDEDASSGMASNDKAIEESVVVDKKSLAKLRREVFQAEEDFYSVFNKLNDEREYDVRCFYEKATGTNIKNHVCRARFVTSAFERHARRNRNDLSRAANQNADPILAEKTAKYEEKMGSLVDANPELQAALEKYNTLRAQFMAQREENANN